MVGKVITVSNTTRSF